MRILWLDISRSPWQEATGWEILEGYNLDFSKATSVEEARAALQAQPVDLFVVNVDISGAEDFVAEIKKGNNVQKNPVIIISEKWNKKDFKKHSQSGNAADNYARIPLPTEGFIEVICAIMNTKKNFLERTQIKIPMDEIKPVEVVLPPTPKIQNSGDSVILKKYLELREQELERTTRDKESLEKKYEQVDHELEELRKQFRELEVLRKESLEKSDRLEKKINEQEKSFIEQKEKIDFEKESLLERVRYLESQLEESKGKYQSLKDRVRKDILKIQVREKELETRLELAKRDAEALLTERDRQVLDLRRKIDTLEFDLDLIQDRRVEAEQNVNAYAEKLSRLSRTLQLAVGMIDEAEEEKQEISKPIVMGGAADSIADIPNLTVENLLKKTAQELNPNELAEAEAPTRIFNAPKTNESSGADELLAGVMEEHGTQPTDAEDKIQTDVDKVAG